MSGADFEFEYHPLIMSRMHLLSALAMDLKIRIKVIQPHYSNGKSPAATFLAYKTVHDVGTDYFNLRSIERLVQRFEEMHATNRNPTGQVWKKNVSELLGVSSKVCET